MPLEVFFVHKIGGGAMVLGLPVLGVLLISIIVGQGPTALAVGAKGAGGGGGGVVLTFFLPSVISLFFLWETAQYRLKYCLKGSLSPNQLTSCTKFFLL